MSAKRMSSACTVARCKRLQLKPKPDKKLAKVNTTMPMAKIPKISGPKVRASITCAPNCSAKRASVDAVLHFTAATPG